MGRATSSHFYALNPNRKKNIPLKFDPEKLLNPSLRAEKIEEVDWELIKLKKTFMAKP
jgi:hypothetical protein